MTFRTFILIAGLLSSLSFTGLDAQEATKRPDPTPTDAPVKAPYNPTPFNPLDTGVDPATNPAPPARVEKRPTDQPGNLPPDLAGRPVIPAPTKPTPPPGEIQKVNATSTSASHSVRALLLKQTSLTPLQRQILQATGRGTEWLVRMNGTTGQFVYGIVPALRVPLEEDNFLHQAGAAFGLARAARFSGDELQLAVASHSILPLFEQTILDKDQPVRYTSFPSVVINRLGAAALIILAVHELPAPQKDLVEPAEELCEFIRRQMRPDGSLACGDRQTDGTFVPESADAQLVYPPLALYALMRSQKLKPAPWKVELVRKSMGYYMPKWRENHSLRSVPMLTATCTEAYLATRDKPFADAVFEMNDWLCTLQYGDQDSRQPLWIGGFMSWLDGKPARTVPTIQSAEYGESLAQAARVARVAVDVKRHDHYMHSLERCLQFLGTLQYAEATTQHFEESYRKRLAGGFHASHQDGNLRIDYSQHALSAMVLYLEQVQ